MTKDRRTSTRPRNVCNSITSGTNRAAAKNSSNARARVLSNVTRKDTCTAKPNAAQFITATCPLITPPVVMRSSRRATLPVVRRVSAASSGTVRDGSVCNWRNIAREVSSSINISINLNTAHNNLFLSINMEKLNLTSARTLDISFPRNQHKGPPTCAFITIAIAM